MGIAFGQQTPCQAVGGDAGEPDAQCAARRRSWVLTVAILGSSLAFVEGSVVNLALPTIQAELQLSALNTQWVVNAYLLVLSALLLIGGASGDRFGLRRVFLIGLTVFGVTSLACALATSFNVLLVARALQGVGAALLIPTSLALISFHYPKAELGRAIGLWAGASALTTALGPVIGGALVDQFGWTAVFFAIVPLAVLAVALTLYGVPHDAARKSEPLDGVGATLLALSLSAATFASLQSSAGGALLLFVSVSAVGMAAFIAWQRRAKAPMVPLALFQHQVFLGANAMTFALYFALAGALYFVPFNLIQVQGYSVLEAGAAFLPLTLLIGAGSAALGQQLANIDTRTALTTGSLVTAVGYLMMIVPGTDTTFWSDWLPAIVLIGVGMTLCVTPLTTVIMTVVDDRQSGVASGINNTAARIAGVIAIALLSNFAVRAFDVALTDALTELPISGQLTAMLLANVNQLAALELPADLVSNAAVESAIANAYVMAFRQIMGLCALMATFSAVIAWFSVRSNVEAT